jgi:hypothetical protein
MIREFLGFAFLVFAVLGLLSWWIHFNKRSSSQGEPQSIDQHDGSLPDSFFGPRASDSPKERKKSIVAGGPEQVRVSKARHPSFGRSTDHRQGPANR